MERTEREIMARGSPPIGAIVRNSGSSPSASAQYMSANMRQYRASRRDFAMAARRANSPAFVRYFSICDCMRTLRLQILRSLQFAVPASRAQFERIATSFRGDARAHAILFRTATGTIDLALVCR
jgi:hypothetical protein